MLLLSLAKELPTRGAYKVLAKSYLGYCKKNNTDDNMIIIHVIIRITYSKS